LRRSPAETYSLLGFFLNSLSGTSFERPREFKQKIQEDTMKRRTAIASLLLAVLIYPPLAMAQQPGAPGDWSVVQNVPPGDELVDQLKDGKSVKGKVASVTSDELSLTRKNKTETVRRDSISQIHHLKRKAEKGKYAAIGAGIGAGAGLGIGLAKNSPPVDDGEIYPKVGAILGAGIGAVGGFLFGQAKRKRVLIYQAR
jgi:hypothetical protein